MKDIKLLEEKIGYEFKNKEIIVQALSHSSYTNERKINQILDYERLEFLGDAVLELTVSEFLYSLEDEYKEGQMTRLRASLVCEPTLSSVIKDNEIAQFVLLGKGEESSGGRNRDSILCDVFESITGALYLDGGIEVAKRYIHNFLLKDWEKKVLFVDSKSILQEEIQAHSKKLTYSVIEENGPSHNKHFVVEALVDGEVISTGEGHSKKAAEQAAAYNYLSKR